MDTFNICKQFENLYININNSKKSEEIEKSLKSLCVYSSDTIKQGLPEVLPLVCDVLNNTKISTAKQSQATLDVLCNAIDNIDIIPFIPNLKNCLMNIDLAPNCIHNLAATTFVKSIDASSLAIMQPVLVQGLKNKTIAIKRKSCVIIENVSKLIDCSNDAYIFAPTLLCILEREKYFFSDPECRSVAERAYKQLKKIDDKITTKPEKVYTVLQNMNKIDMYDDVMTALRFKLNITDIFDINNSYFSTYRELKDVHEIDEAETLCDTTFSLAYGAKILLNKTQLCIKRGRRYGLCGPNGSGKSTLMKAIANNQVDGFPSPSEVKTIYVEHDIDSDTSEILVKDYLIHADAISLLYSYGFDDTRIHSTVGSLSGGWKMKLALAKAMCANADILLLDEPTNHLDTMNVQWLMDYLKSLTHVTSIVVSHDSKFLDSICEYIIHYEDLKLVTYKGNLAEFVKQVPSAASYYSLEDTTLDFRFPTPGYLEGVKNKDKALIKLTNVSFGYTQNTFHIQNATIQCSLSSRVGVEGPNGAGKSTLIKLLTGELKATQGMLWRHPNVRIAYVAQHAFHHIEKHLDKTANQYMQWRFAGHMDREALEKDEFKLSEEEQHLLSQPRTIKINDKDTLSTYEVKLIFDKITMKRTLKGNDEYEIAWKHSSVTTWMNNDMIKAYKFEKVKVLFDQKQAAMQAMIQKPLTQKAIAEHLEHMGLDPEFSTHSLMRGLSGGQKVKVVIGSAMWYNPHIIVLDEPTNYLDRDSLAALAKAINNFEGGVVIISHNKPFIEHTCTEKWLVQKGVVGVSGNKYKTEKLLQNAIAEQTYIDSLGNTVTIKPKKKKLSKKEEKARKKLRAAARERGEDISSSEEEL